ncbi:MAG: PIN domain-containing protein [Terrimicrobiaceae bacterium]
MSTSECCLSVVMRVFNEGGNLSTDALIAAQAFENGAAVYSNDRDFDRFPRVKRSDPLRG